MNRMCLFLAALGSASAALADAPDEIQLKEVRVTATKVERGLQEVPHSVGVVEKAEILRKGTTSIADLLRDIPGVQVEDGAVPGQKRIGLRGESAARVLLLIDGQRVSEQKSMSGAVFLVDPSIVERIEVIKGPASVLYGSEAIAGVVNIITRRGAKVPLELEAGATYDSATDGWRGHVMASGKVKGFSYNLSGYRSDQGDRRTPDGVAANTSFQEKGGRLYVEQAWERLTLFASAETHVSDMRVFTPDGVISAAIPYFHQDLPEWSRKKASVGTAWRPASGPLAKLSADVYHQTTYKDFFMDMDIQAGPGMTVQTRNRTQNDLDSDGLHLQSDWALPGGHYLIAGFEGSRDRLGADETRRSRMLPMRPVFSQANYRDEAEATVTALFVQDEWQPANGLTLTGGLRQTWVKTELEKTTDPTLKTASNRDQNLVGSLGVAWKVAAPSTLRLNLSQGYRFATLQQLYMGTVHGSSSPTFGNPDLKPETSRSLELGWRTNTERAAFDVAVFRSENRDYITTLLSPTPTYPNALQFRNVDRATSQGLEAAATVQVTPTLSPYTSFTWLRRRFESTGFTTWKTGSPSCFGQAGLRYETAARTGFGFHADAFLRFADRADLASSNGTVEAVPGWTTLNLSTGLHFGARGQHQLAVNLQNLLDRSYRTAFETVLMAGRSVSVSLRSTF